ncbi:exopolysaccharide biosynthesis protein [Henriciella sp.]|uniref:exopolysaccharide biosynthesis protein n=1 Tax=Henriciella sp. TaxID=1968823 RepID=UPI002627E38E|nr:exopolysaccharide biosynthesis protein [Henriciella sp.]
MVSRDDPLENVLERALEETDGEDITFGDILELFGDRSFGPVVALLGLIVVLPPIGAIPGLPAIVGILIILFSAQIILGADHIWVPRFIEKRSISKKQLKAAEKRARPWLRRFDRLVSERIDLLTGKISIYFAAIIVTLLALTMIPLEFVPFAVAIPGAAITLFGLAFVARDGILMLFGYAASAATIYVTIAFTPWSQISGFFGG